YLLWSDGARLEVYPHPVETEVVNCEAASAGGAWSLILRWILRWPWRCVCRRLSALPVWTSAPFAPAPAQGYSWFVPRGRDPRSRRLRFQPAYPDGPGGAPQPRSMQVDSRRSFLYALGRPR